MKKINILCMLFSYNTNNGKTIEIINHLLELINKRFSNCSIQFLQINVCDKKIQFCHGCKKCFETGVCYLDSYDSIGDLKEELLKCDLLIIGTPIYVNDIPGLFKTFLDRVSSWTHIMRLNACPTVVIITSINNGIDRVSRYLFKILSLLGSNVIGLIQITNTDSSKKVSMIIESILNRFEKNILYSDFIKTNTYLETYFKINKYLFSISEANSYEVLYWKNIINSEIDSYFELVNKTKR